MPQDPSDPPRKYYEFKPRDFERANEPAKPLPPSAANPSAAPDPNAPIDVRDLHRQAATPGPVLSREERGAAENEVHAILRDNLARANAAGLNDVSVERTKKRRRLRDFILLLVFGNAVLGALAVQAHRTGNVYTFVSAVGGIGAFTAGLTWVMWFVMDDY